MTTTLTFPQGEPLGAFHSRLPARKPSRAENEAKAPTPKGSNVPTFLYLLRDPDTGAVRYAGKADDPERRLKTHISDSRRRNGPVQCWVRALGRAGKSPVLSVLCAVERSQWEMAERALIATLRESGADLLNLAPGGNEPKPRQDDSYLAENGRKVARLVHDDPRARRRWELRKEAGQIISWLRSRGDTARVQKLQAALARLNASEAACR